MSAAVAVAVVKVARDSGLGKAIPDAEIPKAVAAMMWNPAYLPTVAVPLRSDVHADDFVPRARLVIRGRRPARGPAPFPA